MFLRFGFISHFSPCHVFLCLTDKKIKQISLFMLSIESSDNVCYKRTFFERRHYAESLCAIGKVDSTPQKLV